MPKNHTSAYLKYLATEGEMSELILAYDWSTTPLGPIETWSKSLLTTAGIILRAKVPMLLWWGDDLIQIYNDAYRKILGHQGKHPYALGKATKECWLEIWPVIGPLINQVKETGEATWQENSLIPILRNGKIEDIYWTFSYSEVIDEELKFGGILVTCFETTARVNAQRIKNTTIKELAEYKIRMNNLIAQAPVAIGLLEGEDFVINTANKKMLQFWRKSVKVIGQPLAKAVPEIKDQGFLEILAEVYQTEKPSASTEHLTKVEYQGVLEEFYFDFTYQKIKGKNNQKDMILVMANDLTEQVNARLNIEQSALQFRQLADSIIQMVWITDEKGFHEYYNKRWYDFTGTDFKTTKGEGWKQILHPDDQQRAWEKWNHSLQTGALYEIEYRLRDFKGDYIWVLSRAAPFFNADGKLIKWFGTCTNIHEQKLLLDQKDEFINIASHELKTPLTTFKAYMQLIHKKKDESLPSSLLKLINSANKSANQIYDLVEDLLDVSNLKQGGIALEKINFNSYQLVQDCCDQLSVDGRYAIKIVGEKDIQVFADQNRIQRVVINFITNAIKYAPQSKLITVQIEKLNETVKIAVIDYGAGISKDKLPHIFDRYYRVKDNNNQSGLGLGLYICAEIIKKHEGEIGVESEMGKGSCFWFSLPIN